MQAVKILSGSEYAKTSDSRGKYRDDCARIRVEKVERITGGGLYSQLYGPTNGRNVVFFKYLSEGFDPDKVYRCDVREVYAAWSEYVVERDISLELKRKRKEQAEKIARDNQRANQPRYKTLTEVCSAADIAIVDEYSYTRLVAADEVRFARDSGKGTVPVGDALAVEQPVVVLTLQALDKLLLSAAACAIVGEKVAQ